MAIDFDFARQIVSELQELQSEDVLLRDPCEIVLSHDDVIESERLKDTKIRVSPEKMNHERVARAAWQDGIGIRVKLFAKAEDHLDIDQLEQWCNFVDQITARIKGLSILGKRAVSIGLRFGDRYDRDALKETSVYSTTLLVGYPAV